MKNTFLLLLFSTSLWAQKNAIKVNLSSLLLKNYSVSYEHYLSKHSTLLLNARIMPNGQIPFASQLQNMKGNSTNGPDFNQFNLGNTAFTAEFRYYLGKKPQNGFYFAPYIRKAQYDFSVPLNLDLEDPNTKITQSIKANFSGNYAAISGGLLLGVQKHLSKTFILDIWIVGGQVGNATANVLATLNPYLNTIYQRELSNQLEQASNDSPVPFTYTVSQDKVNISANSLAPGLRGLGFNLGFQF
ncbi:DUF3575 domain-containing protein [Sandaracinomonas limnophila]|uniref:DUF3575 domain-containing protein n=1 Tax=Sandaracinomonas limnophila TaxID=1862386 RepID=A0A437PXK2_9BACT|nr:DUF3575 domain-containing protein [Sandaracinomonas limnophila]RVU26994.1 DUF3575 domain-containing protein [Sandaracinomonas limnophila]